MHRGRDDKEIATAEQTYLHVDSTAAKAAPADPQVRARLEALRNDHAVLAAPSAAGRAVGH
jgi:acyl-CoA thioesterase FadM